jgi:hypothetical protein
MSIKRGNETCHFICCFSHSRFLTFLIHGKIVTPIYGKLCLKGPQNLAMAFSQGPASWHNTTQLLGYIPWDHASDEHNFSFKFRFPCWWGALRLCTVNFSTSNYNFSKFFLIGTSFFLEKRPSWSCRLVMLRDIQYTWPGTLNQCKNGKWQIYIFYFLFFLQNRQALYRKVSRSPASSIGALSSLPQYSQFLEFSASSPEFIRPSKPGGCYYAYHWLSSVFWNCILTTTPSFSAWNLLACPGSDNKQNLSSASLFPNSLKCWSGVDPVESPMIVVPSVL